MIIDIIPIASTESPTASTVLLGDSGQQSVHVGLAVDLTMDQIQKRFEALLTELQSSMIDQNVPVQTVASHMKRLGVSDFDEERLEQAKSSDHDLVFSIVRKYCSFLDIDLLENVVQNCGNDADISKVEKYKEDLNAFCNKRLSEMPSNTVSLGFDRERERIVTGLSLHNPTLREIKDFKINLCKVLNLEPHCLQVIAIVYDEECTQVFFHILEYNSRILINDRLTEDQKDALEELPVFHVVCSYIIRIELLHTDETQRFVTVLYDVNYRILIEACKNAETPIATVVKILRRLDDVNHTDKVRLNIVIFVTITTR